MQYKVGDKVRFLDEPGGGKIVKIIDNKMVVIQTEDGFELPVLISDIIPDYRYKSDSSEKSIKQSQELPENKNTTVDVNIPEENITSISAWKTPKEEPGIYLAYEPQDQQWLLTGKLEIFLINHTHFDVLYNLFLERNEQIIGIDYGSIPPDSKISLTLIEKDDIELWNKGILQLMFHTEQSNTLFLPVHSDFNIKTGRFFKEGSYTSNTLTNSKALISIISLISSIQKANTGYNAGKNNHSATISKGVEKKELPFIEKYKTGQGEAVVDLHIAEIIDNIAGLSSSDMLKIQLNHFKNALESAIANDYHKVTFIHGVGNGTLKNEIVKEIKIYELLESKQAAITKFGVGAIDVIIKDNFD